MYLLREFLESPEKMMAINKVKNIFNIVYQTARTYLLELVEIGFLKANFGEKKVTVSGSKEF